MCEVISGTTIQGVDISLRLLKESDIDDVMALEKSAHSHPWRRSSFEDCLKGRQKCWLAFFDKKLVGLVVVTHGGGDSELLNISVAPHFQRRGIGQYLLHHAISLVEGKADMLFLEVRRSNAKAIELYSKEGFFEVGQRRNYYPTANGHEDAILMAFQLKSDSNPFIS